MWTGAAGAGGSKTTKCVFGDCNWATGIWLGNCGGKEGLQSVEATYSQQSPLRISRSASHTRLTVSHIFVQFCHRGRNICSSKGFCRFFLHFKQLIEGTLSWSDLLSFICSIGLLWWCHTKTILQCTGIFKFSLIMCNFDYLKSLSRWGNCVKLITYSISVLTYMRKWLGRTIRLHS